jgi:alpha-methylacyl-CoA racemase
VQPSPAPRFSATPAELGSPPPLRGEHTDAVLRDAGFSAAEIDALRAARAIG